jgi:tetratricopeptide (TPR) repeat protein
VPSVLATMGRMALNSLQFNRGAKYLEAAAASKQASDSLALYKAAIAIRIRLGQRAEAEKDLRALIAQNAPATEKAAMAMDVARLHVQADDWDAVVRLLHEAKRSGAASAEFSYLLGYAYYRRADYRNAEATLSDAVRQGQGGNEAEREAAAAAQFYRAEIGLKAFRNIQLSNDLNQLGVTLQNKMSTLAAVRTAYTEVVSMKSATWSIAALGRLAEVDRDAAAELRALTLPAGLPPEVVKEVKGALEEQAAPLSKEATEALNECAKIANKFTILTAAAKACLAGRPPTGDPQSAVRVPAVNTRQPAGAEALQRALAANPKDVASMEKLGRLYLADGNPYMGRMILEKSLELEESASRYNLLAVAATRLGDIQDAYEYLRKAIKEDGQYLYARVNRAALLKRFGYHKLAEQDLATLRGRAAALSADDVALIPDALTLIGGAP